MFSHVAVLQFLDVDRMGHEHEQHLNEAAPKNLMITEIVVHKETHSSLDCKSLSFPYMFQGPAMFEKN